MSILWRSPSYPRWWLSDYPRNYSPRHLYSFFSWRSFQSDNSNYEWLRHWQSADYSSVKFQDQNSKSMSRGWFVFFFDRWTSGDRYVIEAAKVIRRTATRVARPTCSLLRNIYFTPLQRCIKIGSLKRMQPDGIRILRLIALCWTLSTIILLRYSDKYLIYRLFLSV